MSEPKKRTYDSSLARMAGNIAAGMVPNIIMHTQHLNDAALTALIAEQSVRIARAIIVELERTQGEAESQ